MNLIEHAELELKIAGYDITFNKDTIDTDDDYNNSIGKCAFDLVKLFASQDHSGFSAGACLQIFNKLANWGNLTPLTNNPDEWIKHENSGEYCYQNKRNSSCFSKDLIEYYDIDEECNREFELDENGNKTGWSRIKSVEDCTFHKLKEYNGK